KNQKKGNTGEKMASSPQPSPPEEERESIFQTRSELLRRGISRLFNQEQFCFARKEPACPPLHHQILEANVGIDIWLNGQGAVEERLKFLHILCLDRNCLRQGY